MAIVLVQSSPLAQWYPQPEVGIMAGNTPLGCCSSLWSTSHFSYTVIPSKLYSPVLLAICASPVHPFFSLCGQSVEITIRFERYEQFDVFHSFVY